MTEKSKTSLLRSVCFKKVIFILGFLAIAGISYNGNCLGARIKPDKQQLKQLTELFDNVSRLCEAEYFKAGELGNDKLITYGIVHSTGSKYASNPDKNGKYRLPASYVDQVVMQYFGKKVNHKSVPGYQYKQGYYLAHVADAGEYCKIVITSVQSKENDVYVVRASYFSPDDNQLVGKDKAIVQRITTDGKSHFVMLEFQKDR
jgi:hypothetical protein